MADPRPNILILMSDQHSKHYLGCYGDSVARTPNLDALAAGGMRFQAAYCPSPLCVPSRMSFLTARRPSANRVWTNDHILSSAIPTWAHALGAAGYETALIGRMHFVGPDQRHGFQERPIGEYMARYPGAPYRGAPVMGPTLSLATTGQSRIAVEQAGWGRTTYQAFDERVADAACDYVRQKRASGEQPFAAVVGFVLPHCPFVAPKALFDYFYPRVALPPAQSSDPPPIRRFKLLRGIAEPLSEERIRVARAAYYGLCEHLDSQVGRVLQALRQSGLERNTLVIYCSDHGEMAGEHGCWWKSNYYEGSVGVPLIASLPGVVPAGQVSDAVVNLMDIGPTLLDMVGAAPMPAVDGRSLWPLLCGQGDSMAFDETLSEHLSHSIEDIVPSAMVRWKEWKLYKYHDSTAPVLYHLGQDPAELHDLGRDPRHEAVREELLARLCRWWDPEQVLAESAALNRDLSLILTWGRVVQPAHEDQLDVPDVENVTLL